MTPDFYSYLIMISKDSGLSLEALKEKVEKLFSADSRKIETSIADDALIVRIDGYTFELAYNEGEHVLEESTEIALKHVADEKKKKLVGSCSKRLEMAGDIDEEMLYFNESIMILEEIGKFKNVFIFDPNNLEFMN